MLNSEVVLKVKTKNHCQYMSQVFNPSVPSQDYLPLLNTNCVTFLWIICHIIVCFTTLNQSLVSVTNTQFPMVYYTDGAMFTHTPHCHWLPTLMALCSPTRHTVTGQHTHCCLPGSQKPGTAYHHLKMRFCQWNEKIYLHNFIAKIKQI